MTKQKTGMFRLIIAAMAGAIWKPIPKGKYYPDPAFVNAPDAPRRKKRTSGSGQARFRNARVRAKRVPKCEPGSFRYHDKLVRHFGRRAAERYGRVISSRKLTASQRQLQLPTDQDFADNPPWAYLQ